MGKVCAMDSKKQIEFIKEAWKKFLEKKKSENQDLDITNLQSIKEIKQAVLFREAIVQVSEEDEIDITEEEITTVANILIQKEIVSKRKPKLKADREYRTMPPLSFNRISFKSYIPRDVVEEINKPPWRSVSEQYEYFNFVADIEDDDAIIPKENKADLINHLFMNRYSKIVGDYEESIIDKQNRTFKFIGYSLADIIEYIRN
jgi:hypothetical protein|tara:strand:- start:153 stop:761 length:609 start_codon:yes stop_codon:yes gene_type:complete